jgi:hypothetical protein
MTISESTTSGYLINQLNRRIKAIKVRNKSVAPAYNIIRR